MVKSGQVKKHTPDPLALLLRRYEALCGRLAPRGPLLKGSVTPRSRSLWRWTRKLKARTIAQYLPAEAAEDFRRAVANHRRLERLLSEMCRLSERILLAQHSLQPPKKRPKTPLT